MADPFYLPDNFEAYFQDKLWNMIPAIYRTLDTDTFNSNGPLREMVNRIGAQAAVLRRSIDRLWEDQSIETCDDWVIPYIGALVATNLVNSLDSRGQRLDVANTVYYRQRKGTVAILEEIAADITGWNVRVVEFFRRMARTRHNFDPPIGLPASGPTAASAPVATGDGATTAFSVASLPRVPIFPGTLQVIVGDLGVGNDNGSGSITGTGGVGLTGTIDYSTGALKLTFTTAPAGAAAISVVYNYLGFDNSLQIAEGLLGAFTSSPIGGWANLRNVYGSSKAQTSFDEFSHIADLRRGIDQVGWQNISHLGVFLWRLYSFAVGVSMPVASTSCPGQYSFDPTGRQVPVFAAASRSASSYGDNWVSPQEWQLPGPISLELMQLALTSPPQFPLYATSVDTAATSTVTPNSLGVYVWTGTGYVLLTPPYFLTGTPPRTTIFPEWGVFTVESPSGETPENPPYFVTYNYGFSSTIGAGPYDRRLPGVASDPTPAPIAPISKSAAIDASHLSAAPVTGTIQIKDSYTYAAISGISDIANVVIQAVNQCRPVLRWPAPAPNSVNEWTLNGGGNQSQLLIDGLLMSGADIVLTGSFDSVTLRCCTLDPGNAAGGKDDLQNTADPSDLYAQSVDQRDLAPCRLWIQGTINTLTLDRCIMGPVRTRLGGSVAVLAVNDSILQGIPSGTLTQPLTAADIADPADLALALLDTGSGVGSLSSFLFGKLSATTASGLKDWKSGGEASAVPVSGIVADFNTIIQSPFYSASLFAGIALSPSTQELAASPQTGAQLTRLNRLLLEEAFPVALGQAALALATGEASLSRTTVLGRVYVHRIEASESILHDFTAVEDTQHGCLRFTAWSEGSIVPRQYECVQIAAQSPIFTSREYGDPGYAQLLASADQAIIAQGTATAQSCGSSTGTATAGSSILQGAQNGSEMGAFAREKNPIKENSILIKYQEYMPLGLAPVLIRVT
jgi:hypothetical protein